MGLLAISGSPRAGSTNTTLLKAAMALAPDVVSREDNDLSFAFALEKNRIHESIAVRTTPLYTLTHVIGLSALPDRCVDLLSVSSIGVLWHREASDLKL